MKNTVNIKQNDSLSNDPNLRDDRNEISPILTFENDSDLSILNSSYQIPDIPKKYIEPIILDTSLPYIPVYIHLKTYDLKPLEKPQTPSILSELRLRCQDDSQSTERINQTGWKSENRGKVKEV